MDFKKLFRKDDKAVSPVIGVILMVAITVILAAAIGSSVFNQNPVQSSSKASINVKAVWKSVGTSATDTAFITIEHLGGDTLDFKGGKAKLTAAVDGASSVTVDTSSINTFSAGDVETVQLKVPTGSTESMPTVKAGSTVNIKITDTSTNQVVCDRDVKF
jgi:archaeal type IV pilus assembly protein PilA